MALFLLFAVPLFFFFIALLLWEADPVSRTAFIVSTFLKGALVFFPGFLVMLIARRIFGFAYGGFLLYLSFFLRDHLVPLLLASAGFLLWQRKLDFPATEEGIFLAVFSFFSGFFALVDIADALARWGSWDAYGLFLLPVLRIAAILLVSLAAQRFFRWEGNDGLAFCGVVALLAALFCLASYLFRISRPGWSITLAVVSSLAAFLFFALRFPRVLRG
jgi:hypothetical protein